MDCSPPLLRGASAPRQNFQGVKLEFQIRLYKPYLYIALYYLYIYISISIYLSIYLSIYIYIYIYCVGYLGCF